MDLKKRNKFRTVLPYKYSNYQDFLKSEDWLKIRFKVLKRDNFKCQYCNNKATEVHHLKYTTKAYHAEKLINLVATCKQCHKDQHTKMYYKSKKIRDDLHKYHNELRIEFELLKLQNSIKTCIYP